MAYSSEIEKMEIQEVKSSNYQLQNAETMERKEQHCSYCKNHDKSEITRQHNCMYKNNCDCILCQLTTKSQTMMRHQQRVWRFQNQKNKNTDTTRFQKCDNCRNHLQFVRKSSHDCPYKDCTCDLCELTKNRREFMKHLQRARRLGVTMQSPCDENEYFASSGYKMSIEDYNSKTSEGPEIQRLLKMGSEQALKKYVGEKESSPASSDIESIESGQDSYEKAYRKPGMAAVRIARIVCVTLLAMTFIVGFFVVSHKWIQTRECNCDKHDSLSSVQQAALLQQVPDLQILDSNKVEDAKEKQVNEGNKEAENNVNLVTEEALQRLEEKEDQKRVNALEEAMKERVEELNKNIKLPVDLLLGNPALAGRNVQCKVQKKQQNIADGIISQAIIVTCDDDENSTEDDSEKTPVSILPPGMRRLNPPMSLLGHIMKILASRPRSEGMRPEITRIERPLTSFPLKPMDSQGPMITPISGSFQAPIMIPNNGVFPGQFAQGAIHIIPIRKFEMNRPEPEAEDESNNEPLMFSSQPPPQLRQIPMIREITGLPLRRPIESSFQPQLPFRNQNEEEQPQRHLMESSFQPQFMFRNQNEEQPQRHPMESPFQPHIIFRNQNEEQPRIIFRNQDEEQPQRHPMESSFQPQIIFRNQNEEEHQRNELPIPFPFANGQLPIRVVRLPSGSNLFRDDEDNEQREETNPEEEQQEGPFPFSPIQQLMNLFPARRTRIIRLRPKQNEEATTSEMLPFPIPRGALSLQNPARELPPIHLPPQMAPMEASGRALPAPVALPEVRVVRFPFIPQPQPISEATVNTHMEVQQPLQEDEQEEEDQRPQIDNHFFLEQKPQNPQFLQNQPEKSSFRKANGEFGPPKTHTVIEASPEPIPLDADIIPFPPQIFRHLGFNPQILSEFKPQSREESVSQIPNESNSQQPELFTSQLPLEFNPMAQQEFNSHPQQESDSHIQEPISFPPEQDDNSQVNKELDSDQQFQEPITQPQFQPRFVAPPPQRFLQGRTNFPIELNSDAEVIDNHDGNVQQEDSNIHRIILN